MPGDTYTVVRSTTMEAPPERIYAQIADFRNWRNWSPWEDLDPQLRRTYSGARTGTGAVYNWTGNRKAGQGRMQITEAVEPSDVHIDLHFEKPWKSNNNTVFTLEPAGSVVRVTWSMTGRRTLLTKVMGVFKSMEDFLGPDFERGLATLKSVAEKSPAT
jgi:hypothetical protein